jgi:hypothetical protein
MAIVPRRSDHACKVVLRIDMQHSGWVCRDLGDEAWRKNMTKAAQRGRAMSAPRSGPSVRRAFTVALMIATIGAALLTIDNLLGFVSAHLIAVGFVTMVAVISVSAGVVAAAGAALARDGARVLLAVAVVGFVAALSPATGSQLWLTVSVAMQALVPLAFAAGGLLVLRSQRKFAGVRVLTVMLLGFAAAWIIAAFVPVALVVFLIAQAGTLVVTAALSLQPLLRRGRSLARELWSSAAVP